MEDERQFGVFHHTLANLSKFEWRGVPFVVCLFRIAANILVDRRKKPSTRNSAPIADDLDLASWPDVERHTMLFQLVDSLPPDQRSVIIKRFIEEKSVREIAQEFGRSEGAPRAGVTAPRAGVTAPRAGVTAPRAGVTAPRAGVTAPRAGVTAPRAGVTAPR